MNNRNCSTDTTDTWKLFQAEYKDMAVLQTQTLYQSKNELRIEYIAIMAQVNKYTFIYFCWVGQLAALPVAV